MVVFDNGKYVWKKWEEQKKKKTKGPKTEDKENVASRKITLFWAPKKAKSSRRIKTYLLMPSTIINLQTLNHVIV